MPFYVYVLHHSGIIIRFNNKTATVKTGHDGYWKVWPQLLRKNRFCYDNMSNKDNFTAEYKILRLLFFKFKVAQQKWKNRYFSA